MAESKSPTEAPDFFADPVVKLAFGMSANGLHLNEIPSETKIGFSDNGAIRANYPDGSTREFIADDSGGGEMVTTHADGSRIESVLSFEDGVISVTSTSSTGAKTVQTIDENGVQFQSISADGTVTDESPADYEALVASWVTATEELAAAISTDDTLTEELAEFTEYVDDSAAAGGLSDFYQPGNFSVQGAQLWQAGMFANSIDTSPEAEGFPEVEFTIEEFEEFEEDAETDTLNLG
jgi:hypothetical protein